MHLRAKAARGVALLAVLVSLAVVALAVSGSAFGSVPTAHVSVKTMPRYLIHQRLPDAESELKRDHIRYRVIGGGVFGIIIKSDWEVCATKPKGGQPVIGTAELFVKHFICA